MISTTIADRYLIEQEIGRGGMGIVFQARDLLLERPVAVKVVSAGGLGSDGHSRLLQEARAAARLNHANIVAVYDVGTATMPDHEEGSYIVMELVDGATLRDSDRLSIERIIDITSDICRALETAHEQGIIHRDLKPENVALTESGTIKLMDFGLARITGKTRLTQQGTFMGTVSYLAPEIILGQEATASSDLYALGVMLYELSAGRPPFEGGDLTAVLSQHLYAPIVPPSSYNGDLPPAMDELIVRLLSKRPEDRPGSARDVRLALERISQTRVESAPVSATEINRLVRGRMVGREDEFGQAARLWQEAAGGNGAFLLISGEPGIGKTRLVRELSTFVEISGGRSLIGYCYESERTPYGPIAQMVEATLKEGRLSDLPATVLADLLALVPEMRLQYPNVPANERLDPESEQRRIFDSIVTWFGALTRESQIMLVVDDVHWADSGSLSLLRHLARRLASRGALIVATYREVELDEALPFQEMLVELNRERLATRIKLARLDKKQTGDLLATLFAEEITPEFLDGIYRETEGNPFFIEEVCKALVERGDLYFEGGRWHRPDMERLEIPQGIKVTIQSRLAKLSRQEQRILQAAAMLGREFEFEMLVVTSGSDEDDLIETLDRADRAQLVEEVQRPDVPRGTRFSFTHALIYSTLVSNLSTLRRQRLQRQVALALERAFPDRRQELAPLLGRYFAEAGEGEKAVEYLVQAGDDARQLYAYDEAIEAYEQALIFLREFDDHRRTARTLMKLGLTYHNAFAFEKSRLAYEEAFVERQRSVESGAAERTADLPEAPHPVRLPVSILPSTIDPAFATDSYSMFAISLLFRGLLELAEDDELVPDIAHSWDVLDDGARYIFHLREDAAWSNGKPVTAHDFAYGLKRVLSSDGPAILAKYLYDIRGAEAYHTGTMADADSLGIEAISDKKLEITLEGPCSYFLYILAQATCVAQPAESIERHGEAWTEADKLVVNGPFLVEKWQRKGVLFRRNPDYHGRFLGNLARIELTVISDQEALDAYREDRVDFTGPYVDSVEEGRAIVQQYPDEYVSRPSGGTLHLFFDVRKPPFDNRRMRQAVALAMDRESVVSRATRGTVLPALGGMVPPGIPGHVAGIGLPFDPELARTYAAETGFFSRKEWPEFELMVADPHNRGGLFNVFAEQWLEFLNLKVRIVQTDFNTVLRLQDEAPTPMMVMGWSADYPDPDTFLRIGSWLRHGGWQSPEYEALVQGARRITDRRQRLAMYRQAERLLVEEAPVIPIAYGLDHALIKPWFEPWPSNQNFFILKDVIMHEH